VAEILELAQLAQPNRVADRHMWPAGVEALFEPQFAATGQLGAQILFDQHLSDAAGQQLIDIVWHGVCPYTKYRTYAKGCGEGATFSSNSPSAGGGRLCHPPPAEKKILGWPAALQTSRLSKSQHTKKRGLVSTYPGRYSLVVEHQLITP
jgi:hypothetical protein